MDANGTRFHLLLGHDDWAACADDQQRPLAQAWASPQSGTRVAWDPVRAQVTLQPRLLRSAASPRPVPLTIADRRGAAQDRYGNWYWIDASRTELLVRSAGSDTTTHFWASNDDVLDSANTFGGFQVRQTAPATPLAQLSGLTVTEDHYLVVGLLQPAGLWIFDLHGGGAPRGVVWPAEIPFVPFDIAPRPGGGAWILDRANARFWALDRHFNVCTDDQTPATLPNQPVDFQPRDPASPRRSQTRTFPAGILLGAASPVNAVDPAAIAALPDGTVLILDRAPNQPFGRVLRYRFGRQLGVAVALSVVAGVVEADPNQPFRLNGHDLAFVLANSTDGALGQVSVVGDDGSQTFALLATLQGDQLGLAALDTFLPMRQFGGKALIEVAADTQPAYDFADRWLPLMAQPRARYESEGALQTPVLDGREPECVWHRLMLDACLPPETTVQLWSRAANDATQLASADWRREPDLYLRGDGSEQRLAGEASGAPADRTGTWELLFQRARGQYLQVKLDLFGNGRSTPRLRALRAYYPRFSYLDHYLPSAYREDGVSASFLDRFLANLEGFYTSLEDRLSTVEVLFDYRSAPPETLAWLAGWFGLVLDPAWDERRRRLLIKHAMDFFQFRGTLRGLEMALRFLLDDWPDDAVFDPAISWSSVPSSAGAIRIIEDYQTRRTPRVALGDPTDLLLPAKPVTQTTRWTPSQGAAVLNARYIAFLRSSGLTVSASTRLPLSPPDASGTPDPPGLWTRFARDALGFVPSAGPADLPAWRDFLARRYQTLSALNKAYGWALGSFDEALLPSVLPQAIAPLGDWFQFEGVVLAMRRTAHRFTVLLPASTSAAATNSQQHLLDLASRLLELEKPAHTVCAVKLFWPMFRLGAVRLGLDTLLDQGSRAPQLMPKLTLQQGSLAESYLAPSYPWDVPDRHILGRDRLPDPGRLQQP